MDLSIIIVNWNSAEYLRKCLRSIYSYTQGFEFEVIVVDNASFDGCEQMLANEFPAAHFIQSEQNLGFARGNNLGASHSSARVLLFLNPDTEIKSPALNVLLDSLAALPDAGAVGARLLNSDGSTQTSCLQTFPTITNQLLDADLLRKAFPNARIWGVAPLFTDGRRPRPTEGISGACLMTRRHLFDKVGGFTEDFFMYYEDMDYCLKIARAGWKNYFIPSATVIHHGGKSSGNTHSRFSSQMMAESAWRFFLKHRGHRYASLFRIGLAAKAASRSCLLAMVCLLAGSEAGCRQATGAFNKWTHVLRWCLEPKS